MSGDEFCTYDEAEGAYLWHNWTFLDEFRCECSRCGKTISHQWRKPSGRFTRAARELNVGPLDMCQWCAATRPRP